MEYQETWWNIKKLYGIPTRRNNTKRFLQYQETLWNTKKIVWVPEDLFWKTDQLRLKANKACMEYQYVSLHGIPSTKKLLGISRIIMEYQKATNKLYGIRRPSPMPSAC